MIADRGTGGCGNVQASVAAREANGATERVDIVQPRRHQPWSEGRATRGKEEVEETHEKAHGVTVQIMRSSVKADSFNRR